MYLPIFLSMYCRGGQGKACMFSHSVVLTLCNIMDCSLPGSLSMEFSRQEYWGGLSCPSPGDPPNPGIEPRSSALKVDTLPSEPLWSNLAIHCFSHHPLRALNDLFPSMQASSNPLRFLETTSFNLAKEQG